MLALGLGQGRKSHLHGRQRAWRDTASSFGACSEAWCHKGSQQGWHGQAHGCEPPAHMVRLVCSRGAASSRSLANEAERVQVTAQEGSHRAHTVAWPERYTDSVTGRPAPGTGDDAVPFTPFRSRPGGLAPTDPRVLGVGGRTC